MLQKLWYVNSYLIVYNGTTYVISTDVVPYPVRRNFNLIVRQMISAGGGGGGGEVEGRWRGGGGEVEGRWRGGG